MFLFHITEPSSLEDILKSKYLLSSKVTGVMNETPQDIQPLPYIFMGCSNEVDRIPFLGRCVFVFPMEILYDRLFYTNIYHSAGNLETSTRYAKHTPLPEIEKALDTIFQKSIKTEKMTFKRSKKEKETSTYGFPYFRVFQEVFFKKRVSIKDASHIVIQRDTPQSYITHIAEKYPYINIVFFQDWD